MALKAEIRPRCFLFPFAAWDRKLNSVVSNAFFIINERNAKTKT